MFVLLEDGISDVRDGRGIVCNDPGGRTSITTVASKLDAAVIGAALDCPGDCIFLEPDGDDPTADDCDVADADVIGPVAVERS